MANEQASAVSGTAHLHTDIERFDGHVALEVCERFAADTAASTVCEIVIESATNRREAGHEQEKEYQLDRAHKKTG